MQIANRKSQIEEPSPQPSPGIPGEGVRRCSRKQLFTLIKWTLCLATIMFVGIALARNLRGVDWHNFHPNLLFILAASACIAMVTVTQIIAYRLLLAAYGPLLTWPQVATLSWVPGLAKYIPGKVVAIGGTVYLLRRYKIAAPIALSVTLMGDAVAVLTGLIVGAPLLLTPQARERLPGALVWCGGLIIISLVCLYPPVFANLINFALKKLKRDQLTAVPRIQYYLLPIVAGFAQWVCWGCAMWCMARAIAPLAPHVLPRFVVIAAIANTIGYLAFFTNGGIGVREFFLALGLNPLIGGANAAIVVIAIRLLQTVVEVVLAGIGVVVLKKIEPVTR